MEAEGEDAGVVRRGPWVLFADRQRYAQAEATLPSALHRACGRRPAHPGNPGRV